MIAGAEGGAGSLHKMTKPTAWRRGVQVLEEVERDCEEKGKEWAKHWQCNTEVQEPEDKPWRNVELRSLEEGLPRMKEGHLEKAAGSYKGATGVGCDVFHPKVPSDLSKESRRETAFFFF